MPQCSTRRVSTTRSYLAAIASNGPGVRLTDPADTTRYWRHREAGGKTFPSDWKKGSRWELVHADIGLVVSDPEMVVLESDPPRRLSYTWHTFTPEWAAAVGLDPEAAASLAGGATLRGRLRAGGDGPRREPADGRPRRLRPGECRAPEHRNGLARRLLQPQIHAGDRVPVALGRSGGRTSAAEDHTGVLLRREPLLLAR